MDTPSEIRRLTQVYRSYLEHAATRPQWDDHNPGNQAIACERQRAIRHVLDQHGCLPLDQKRILDVGCGAGHELAHLLHIGANPNHLVGVDLMPDRIASAQRYYPSLNFIVGNAESLAFPDVSFDLVLLFTVFTSILDDRMAKNVSHEILRVLKPGGVVIWYDFRYNNPRNPHVRGMNITAIRKYFAECHILMRTITLLPPLARRLGQGVPLLYPLLSRMPFLRTHYIGVLVKVP
jgi:ubiquinone/menaquinone biosynthesis C-methylase UbiE